MLADDVAAALPEMQAHAESLMVDTATITRPGVGMIPDPDGGPYEVPATSTTVYTGRVKVATYQPYETAPDVGGQTVVSQRYAIHVPVSAGPFEIGDVVTITTSPNLPATTGRQFRIAGLHEKTWQTAQRMLVDEAP